ncbi:signal peptidase I [Cellulomonas sp. NPDC089187]|uniref:signal peptidase I n=1 Tax=Cellulomonas sp. NPDC089187 TaxID=3154970 RepID=UPI0034490E40
MSRRTAVTGRRPAVRVRRAWYDSPWRIAGQAVSSAIAVLLVALIAALVVVPKVTGGTSLTVLSGSMEPTFAPGDVLVVRGVDSADVCAEIAINDVITYFPKPDDPTLISHRVVGKTIGTFDDGTRCRLVTQGDANSAVDDPISPEQVRGVLLYGIPKLGWLRQWAGDHIQPLMIAAAVALIGWGLWSTIRRPQTRVLAVPTTGGTPDVDIPAASHPTTEPALPVHRDLLARELDLRERELALRERELAFAQRTAGLPEQENV